MLRKFRWSKNNRVTWNYEEQELPFNLAGVLDTDTVWVEPIGEAVANIGELPSYGAYLITFGDSITEFEFSAGANDTIKQTGLQLFRPGQGSEIGAALMRVGHRIAYEAFNKTTGGQPGFGGQSPKLFAGGNYAQSGATISAVSDQIDYAAAEGVIPTAIAISVGTNSLPFDTSTKSQHAALIAKCKMYWPNVPIAVANIRPVSGAQNTYPRTVANITAANTMIADNVSAAGAICTLIDVYTSYASRGSGGLANTGDTGDGLHPNIRGAQAAGSPLWAAWLSTLPAGDVVADRRTGSAMPTNLRHFTGADTSISVAAGGAGNAGTISGVLPLGMSAYKSGNVNSNVVCSTVSNPETGGKTIRLDITKVSGNAAETIGLRPTAINADTTTALAGTWFETIAKIRDDRNSGWRVFTHSWSERSNQANNYGNMKQGMYPDGGAGERTCIMLGAPKRGELSSTGHAASMTFQFDPSVAETMTVYIDYWDTQIRTAPVGA